MDIVNVIELEVARIKGQVHRHIEWGKNGVYLFLDKNHRVLYIGQGSVRDRVNQHLKDNRGVAHNYHLLRIIYLSNVNDIRILEEILINCMNPIFNIVGRHHLIEGVPSVYDPKYNIKHEKYGLPEWVTRRYGEEDKLEPIDQSYMTGYSEGFDDGYEQGYKFRKRQGNLGNI